MFLILFWVSKKVLVDIRWILQIFSFVYDYFLSTASDFAYRYHIFAFCELVVRCSLIVIKTLKNLVNTERVTDYCLKYTSSSIGLGYCRLIKKYVYTLLRKKLICVITIFLKKN